MKLLITGGSGFVGSELAVYFKPHVSDIYTTYFTGKAGDAHSVQVDLSNKDQVNRTFDAIRPDVVIHAAGNKNVQQCQADLALARKMNVTTTKQVSECCASTGASLVFLSTDYVFKGDAGHYRENDRKEPSTNYGLTKSEAEDYLVKENRRCLIVRAAAIYGRKSGFIQWLISSLATHRPLRVFENLYFSPTSIQHLYERLRDLIQQKLTNEIIHVTDNERISRFDFSRKLAHFLGFDANLIQPDHYQSQGEVPMLKDSSLNSDRVFGKLGGQPGIDAQLQKLSKDYFL